MCTAEVREKQKLTAANALEKLLECRLSVPQLMAVYVIYDVGEILLIQGVSCPAGMCSCIIFSVSGNLFRRYISSAKTGPLMYTVPLFANPPPKPSSPTWCSTLTVSLHVTIAGMNGL